MTLFSLLVTANAMMNSACIAPPDYYSQVKAVCNFSVPNLGEVILDKAEITATYLTPECKSALEVIIPFDANSWSHAPTGMKDRVLEAFQALIAYPLAVPAQNTLFGVAQDPAGAIPGDIINILHGHPGDTTPNQAIFNWIINKVDTVKYSPITTDQGASYLPVFDVSEPRVITIYENYWNLKGDPNGYFRVPFLRTSLLIHEAYHGTGQSHALCTDISQGLNCDTDLKSPYGFEISYLHYLVMGSGTCLGENCTPPLTGTSLTLIGNEMCELIETKIIHPFPALLDRLRGEDGKLKTCGWFNSIALLDLEGLPPLPKPAIDGPYPSPSPTPVSP